MQPQVNIVIVRVSQTVLADILGHSGIMGTAPLVSSLHQSYAPKSL